MPLAILIERIKDSSEQMVPFAESEVAEMHHKELVKQGLDNQVQGGEALGPIVSDKKPLDSLAQRLPDRCVLPDGFAVVPESILCKLGVSDLQLALPIREPLHTTDLVCRLQ